MEYLGQYENRLYYKFNNGGEEKLNVIDRDTKKVYVREYSKDALSEKAKNPTEIVVQIILMSRCWFTILILKTKKMFI